MKELLSEMVLESYGTCEKVLRFWRGWYPELPGAVLVVGLTGKETKQEIFVIRPIRTFMVEDKK